MNSQPNALSALATTTVPEALQAKGAKAAFHHVCMPVTVKSHLQLQDINPFMALHDIVTEACPYVKKRSVSDLVQHLASGHTGIGIYAAQGHMIGQALLTFPELDGASNVNGYPVLAGQYAIIQSVGVDPEHKKCGISSMLFSMAEITAKQMGKTSIIAKMNADNTTSQKAFNKAGYTQAGPALQVEGDNYQSVFMVKKLGSPAPKLKVVSLQP